jgi:hypothetical protein
MDMGVVIGMLVGAASLAVNGLILWKIWEAFRTKKYWQFAGGVGVYASAIALVVSLIMYSASGVSGPDSPPVRLNSAQKAKLALLTQAVQGSVAASAPSAARQYVPFLVEMRVAPGNLPSVLQQTQASASAGTTVVGEDDITLTPKMEGRISGDGFTVEPKDRQAYSQVVAANKVTTWSWLVTPVSSGSQNLRIMLIGKVKAAKGDEAADHDLYAKSFEIKVQVDPPEYVKRNFLELASMAGAVIAALAAAFWAWWTWFKPKREPPPPAPPAPMSPFPTIPRPKPGKTTDAPRPGGPPAQK